MSEEKKKVCKNCKLFIKGKKDEHGCQHYPQAVIREEGTCRYCEINKD